MHEYSTEGLKAAERFQEIKTQYMKIMGESWDIVKKEFYQIEVSYGIEIAIDWLSYHPLDCAWKIIYLGQLYKKQDEHSGVSDE